MEIKKIDRIPDRTNTGERRLKPIESIELNPVQEEEEVYTYKEPTNIDILV